MMDITTIRKVLPCTFLGSVSNHPVQHLVANSRFLYTSLKLPVFLISVFIKRK